MIPRTVLVNGVRYRVDVVPKEKLGGDAGECRPEVARILIAKELSPEVRASTYLHELGHATAYESGAQEIMRRFAVDAHGLEELLVQVWLPAYRRVVG